MHSILEGKDLKREIANMYACIEQNHLRVSSDLAEAKYVVLVNTNYSRRDIHTLSLTPAVNRLSTVILNITVFELNLTLRLVGRHDLIK